MMVDNSAERGGPGEGVLSIKAVKKGASVEETRLLKTHTCIPFSLNIRIRQRFFQL
jgi:hypothetical protein